jgi:hypothetical protein
VAGNAVFGSGDPSKDDPRKNAEGLLKAAADAALVKV